MARFQNKVGISKIVFNQNIQAFCPLGGKFYTNQVKVEMVPNEIIPDYCEVEEEMRALAPSSLTLEDCVAAVFDILVEYKPKYLKVSSYTDDAAHFPVTVYKVRTF